MNCDVTVSSLFWSQMIIPNINDGFLIFTKSGNLQTCQILKFYQTLPNSAKLMFSILN